LQGVWVLTTCNGLSVECPDVVSLNENSTYQAFNDCYSRDPSEPIIETGSWETVGDSIHLKRKILTNDDKLFDLDESSLVLFYEVQNNLMKIRVHNRTELNTFCYKRKLD
jgi:hypothetical protein